MDYPALEKTYDNFIKIDQNCLILDFHENLFNKSYFVIPQKIMMVELEIATIINDKLYLFTFRLYVEF